MPIRPGARDGLRDLLAEGLPFDPEQIEGIDRHEVFITPEEAIFVFESHIGTDALASLLVKPDFWQAAITWGEHIAAAPRIAEGVYSWTRSQEPQELSYLPTPGPGDSDGGDIF